MKKRIYKNIYLLLSLLGGVLLLWGGRTAPLLYGVGVLLLPYTALAAMHPIGRWRRFILMACAALLCMMGAPSYGWGATLFMLWYGPAILQCILLEFSPDLFDVLLYGGSLYGGLTCGAVCWAIRDHYGVWDIRGAFTAVEQMMLRAVDQMEQLYTQVLPAGEELQTLQAQLDILRQGSEAFVYQWLGMGLTLLGLQYFLSLKAAAEVYRNTDQPIIVSELWSLSVPRSITVVYMLTYLLEMFWVQNDYYFALNIANTLMGYLFVLVGIGWVDCKMKNQQRPLRIFVKLVLVLLSVISQSMMGLAYSLLSIIGIFLSFNRQFIIRRKGDDQ